MFYKQLFRGRAAFLLAMSCFLVGSAWARDETPRAQVRSLALSTSYDCALLTDGRVKCWGGHSRGVYVPGNHKQNDFWATPITVGGLTDAIEIAVGGERGCAIIRNGSVMCWDAGKKAGSADEADHALTVGTLVGVTQLVMGDEHACVLLGGGTVKCWGENRLGQLGNGTKTPSSTPVSVAGLSNVMSITTNGLANCALLRNSEVTCWGIKLDQVDDINSQDYPVTGLNLLPAKVPELSGVTSVEMGFKHACALTGDRHVKCWGKNDYGQLGNDSADESEAAVKVASLGNAKKISVGSVHACALLRRGEIKCWGNAYGDAVTHQSVATALPGLKSVQDIVMDRNVLEFVCAIGSDHGVFCADMGGDVWKIAGLNDAIAITSGPGHSCVVRKNGSVMCFGNNAYGQLGNGHSSLKYARVPTQVIGLP